MKINEINKLLEYYAGIHDYEFIDNGCIGREHLQRDQLHLNREGISILTNNFLSHVNSISLLAFNNIWLDKIWSRGIEYTTLFGG